MRHKRFITIGIAAIMLVSLCAAAAATSVTAATDSRSATAASIGQTGIVGAGTYNNLGTAVCSWGPGRLDVFANGAGQLWHRWWIGSWSKWEQLGSPTPGLFSAPTAVSWGPGRIDVFARGYHGDLFWRSYDANRWSNWVNLGIMGKNPYDTSIAAYCAPAASSWGPGRLDVFAVGTDGYIWQNYYQNGGWSGWINLGLPGYMGYKAFGSPSAVSTSSWGYKRVDVFVRGDDGVLYQMYWSSSTSWKRWTLRDSTGNNLRNVPQNAVAASVPSPISVFEYSPAVCSSGPNRLDVFFVDASGHLQQKSYDNGWIPSLSQVGGSQQMPGPGGAVTWQQGGKTRLDLFWPGNGLSLYQKYYKDGAWVPDITNWTPLGMIS